MKPRLSPKRNAAMTLFEVGVVLGVVLILAVIFLPRAARKYSPESVCINNLKYVGLACRIWAGDNNDILPMGISVTNGGSMELVATGDVIQSFLVMSNELNLPNILICPRDATHGAAASFSGLSNSNISYCVSADMTNLDNPQIILSGDFNFELGGVPVKSGLRRLGTNDPVSWSSTTRHRKTGNIALADGSVQTTTTAELRQYLQETGLTTNSLALP